MNSLDKRLKYAVFGDPINGMGHSVMHVMHYATRPVNVRHAGLARLRPLRRRTMENCGEKNFL